MRRKWNLPPVHPGGIQAIAHEWGLHPLLAQILLNRGIQTPTEAGAFLSPSFNDLHHPLLLKDMERAVGRLRLALSRKEKILLYGDYDVDGITGMALLWLLLRGLGGNVAYYLPDRIGEGYGIKEEVIRRAQREGVGVIIAIDQGINAEQEAALARELGVDLVICDHHLPGERIPAACAVLNPLQPDCSYPFKPLAAVGVVYKLCQGLAEGTGLEGTMGDHLDLVALGTIADVVPLKGENRIFAHLGLRQLQRSQKPGIRALLEASRLSGSPLGAGHVAFVLGPRLNAAGRVREAKLAFRLLSTESPSEASRLAGLLEELNRERQELERSAMEEAAALVEGLGRLPKAICLSSEGWHVGVIGIVASRLVERTCRPVAVISLNESTGRGSARSIPGYPIHQALGECSQFLEGFGGHALAAGFTLMRNQLASFVERFQEVAESHLSEDDFRLPLSIDGEVSFEDLSPALVVEMKRLEPFGLGNPEPTLVARGCEVMKYPRVVGGNHLKMKVRREGKVIEAIGFGMGEACEDIQDSRAPIDLAFCPTLNTFQGRQSLQLRIKDLAFPS